MLIYLLTLCLCLFFPSSVRRCRPPGKVTQQILGETICIFVWLWHRAEPKLSLPAVSSCRVMKFHLHFRQRWIQHWQWQKNKNTDLKTDAVNARPWQWKPVWRGRYELQKLSLLMGFTLVCAAQSADELGGEHGRGGRSDEEAQQPVRPHPSHQDVQWDARPTETPSSLLTALRLAPPLWSLWTKTCIQECVLVFLFR